MKISVNVDCTPEEARTFFGLPDVAPVNEMIVSAMTKRTQDNIESLSDPKIFWERAMGSSGTGMDMMSQMMTAAMGKSETSKDKA